MGTAYLIHGLADGMGKEAFADAYAHPEDWPEDWDTGDIEDAIRHCTAACMLTASFGSGRALTVLECHERLAGHSAGIEMDRWNNDRGIELSNTSPPPSPYDCLARCLDALANGELSK